MANFLIKCRVVLYAIAVLLSYSAGGDGPADPSCIHETLNAQLEGVITRNSPRYVPHHRLKMGERWYPTLPGMAIAEMVVNSAWRQGITNAERPLIHLKALKVRKGVCVRRSVDEAKVPVKVTFTPRKPPRSNIWEFTFKSSLEHAKGDITNASAAPQWTTIDWTGPAQSISPDRVYVAARERGIHYGKSLRTITDLKVQGCHFAGSLKLPELVGGNEGYLGHPVIWDGLLQAANASAARMEGASQQVAVPGKITDVFIDPLADIGRDYTFEGTVTDFDEGFEGKQDGYRFEARLLNSQGQLVLHLTEALMSYYDPAKGIDLINP